MKKEISLKMLELYDKCDENGSKKNVQFTKKEISFLKKHINRSKFRIIYCWWLNENSKRPLGYVIDSDRNATRKSSFFNSIEIISTRDLSDKEFMDFVVKQYGTRHRRFMCYWYNSIPGLIEDDKSFNAETPKEVIEFAKKKGLKKGYQTSLDFNG